ncbi:MAG TPA: Crp/Fnr family transcriptional regulator [Thermodesulfobacteriota bacterium]
MSQPAERVGRVLSPEVLRGIPYFAEVDAAGREALARAARLQGYRAGEVVLLEGAPCRGLYVVVEGRVKVYKASADGKEQVLRILGPGRTFNDVPVFDGGPNPGSVAALERTTVALLPKAEVLALLDRDPKVAKAVIRVLAARLRALTVVIEDLSLRSVVARVARLLLDCTRGQPALVEGPEGACARLTQQQLAAMTGSVREVVQRALKTLERDGAIRLERARVIVLDPDALARWAEADGRGGR